MATSTYGTPYVQGSDLVSAYPTASSNLATRVDEVSYKRNGLNAQTGTTYTLVVGDAGKTITLSNASPVAVTLPQDSTADLPDGAVVTFYNLGAGTVTISQGTGATLQGGSITLTQYAVTSVIKLSADTYGKFDSGTIPGISNVTPTSIANTGGTASLSGNTVTFSGVSTISLNGCFTGNFDNYVITFDGTNSTQDNVNLRLRVSGVDAATAYCYANLSTSDGAGPTRNGSAAATSLRCGILSSTRGFIVLQVSRPFAAEVTGFIVNSSGAQASAAFSEVGAGNHATTTAYDGFTLIPAAGNLTGNLRVYGFQK